MLKFLKILLKGFNSNGKCKHDLALVQKPDYKGGVLEWYKCTKCGKTESK